MDLHEVIKELNQLQTKFNKLKTKVNLEKLDQEIAELLKVQEDSSFWDNPTRAQKTLKDLSKKEHLRNFTNQTAAKLEELQLAIELAQEQQLTFTEVDEQLKETISCFNDYEILILLDGEYDNLDAFIEIHPGAGGTESQDWAQMIYRMYQRYFKKAGFRFEEIDYQPAEVGLKSVLVKVQGENAYGIFSGENGIHRLVRISPFDSAKKRHTSFCSVRVMPVINDEVEIEIKPQDLKIDTYRSSGAGGQSVNTTDSAVRLTHLPTGTVVTCQNERSQLQNKEQALKILQAKLLQLELEQKKQEQSALAGESKTIGWGSQKRSYILHPYKMLKDNISGYETAQVESVLEGEMKEVLYHNLISKNGAK